MIGTIASGQSCWLAEACKIFFLLLLLCLVSSLDLAQLTASVNVFSY